MKLLLLLSIVILFATTALSDSITPNCKDFPANWFINNPNDCRAYWFCADPNDQPETGRCPEGYNFDEKNQLCSEHFPCDDNEPPETTTQPPWEGSFTCPPNGVFRFELPGSCTRYHFCFAGSHQVRECGSGLHFDTWIGRCNFPGVARCTRDLCPATNDIDNIVTFPSETSCEQYFMCLDGSLHTFFCAWGIHWNQSTQKCELPENAQCEVISTTSQTWPTSSPTWPPTSTPTWPPTSSPTWPPTSTPTWSPTSTPTTWPPPTPTSDID